MRLLCKVPTAYIHQEYDGRPGIVANYQPNLDTSKEYS